jgi:hypothetical protein
MAVGLRQPGLGKGSANLTQSERALPETHVPGSLGVDCRTAQRPSARHPLATDDIPDCTEAMMAAHPLMTTAVTPSRRMSHLRSSSSSRSGNYAASGDRRGQPSRQSRSLINIRALSRD